MSEELVNVPEETVEVIGFKTVTAYVTHLEESTEELLEKAEVIDTLKAIVSRPAGSGQRRGQLAGLTVETMDDEQLKREIINAKSVLYKAQQRGAGESTIEKNQSRVDAALAEKAKRTPEAPVTAEVAATEDAVYASTDLANEL